MSAEATFNVGSSEKKLSMSLDEIIKAEHPPKQRRRAVGKDGSMRPQTAKQRKANVAENAKRNASDKRAQQISAKRGLPQSPAAGARKAKSPRVNRAFGASWSKQQQQRELNARKKASKLKGGVLGAGLSRATAAPASSAVGRALRRGAGRRTIATARAVRAAPIVDRPITFKVKLNATRTGINNARLSGSAPRRQQQSRQQQSPRGQARQTVQQRTGRQQQQQQQPGRRIQAARLTGKTKAQRLIDQRRGMVQQQQQQPSRKSASINDMFSANTSVGRPQQRRQQRQQQQPLAGRISGKAQVQPRRGGQQQQQQQPASGKKFRGRGQRGAVADAPSTRRVIF